MQPVAIERALVSVYEKTGIVEFARALAQAGVEVVSTGGTAKLLRESGVKVREVSELTGWPEMLGGRVKTLHPKVHGGILFRRNRPDDGDETRKQGIAPIDLVVVNLYPFEATAARADISAEDLIENIDIGGPAMVRSAAKNFESVAVVTDPSDYASLLAEFGERRDWSLKTRLSLARKAFAMTARYDSLIATELERLRVRRFRDFGRASGVPGAIAFGTFAARFAALRRESASEIGPVHSQRRARIRLGRGAATSRQGAFLQ